MAITDTALNNLLAERKAVLVKFSGVPLILDAAGALYCATTDTLVVSDLHLEKGSYLTQFGHPIPALDTLATLSRLRSAVQQYRPRSVVCLGDSFHDTGAHTRMSEDAKSSLKDIAVLTRQWVWVLGNHDPEIPESLPGRSMEKLQMGTLDLQHEPQSSGRPQIIGHFHPKCETRVKWHRYRGSCFVVHQRYLVMPAFGAYTGGLNVNHPALLNIAPAQGRRCFMLYQSAIYQV